MTTAMGAEPDGIAAAADKLYRMRDLQDATASLRRFLSQIDEETRAAALEAAGAGLTERMIAARLGITQPTVHGWLDERRSAPLPSPSLASEVWGLHTMTAALQGLTARLEGRHLPDSAPSGNHGRPAQAARNARNALAEAADSLATLGAALAYQADV